MGIAAAGTAGTHARARLAATPTPAPTPAPAPVPNPKEPFYGSRFERSFSMTPATADRLEALIAPRVPRETQYPNPQRVQTVYVRRADPSGPWGAFRIRTYPDSPGPPNFLEFKDKVVKDGQKVTEKLKIPVAADLAQRLLWGDSGAAAIGRADRSPADLAIAERAIKIVDELNLRPVVRQEYVRASYEDAKAGVRMTFDRGIHFTGIGELARAGSARREDAVMDVKIIGKTPPWLSSLIDAEMAAGQIKLLDVGKGSIAVDTLAARLRPPKGMRAA